MLAEPEGQIQSSKGETVRFAQQCLGVSWEGAVSCKEEEMGLISSQMGSKAEEQVSPFKYSHSEVLVEVLNHVEDPWLI